MREIFSTIQRVENRSICTKKVRACRKRNRCGQAMIEYLVALGVFLALLGLCAALMMAFRAYGNRVLDIISVS